MVCNQGDPDHRSKASVLDAISRGFSYPIDGFYSDLLSGDYIQALRQGGEGINDPAWTEALSELEAGIGRIGDGRSREDLETEYIALFEHNHRQEPLRLYCGLYLQGKGARLETMQGLIRLYREYGLDMEDGAENADHLTVVLEFLSFLYKQTSGLEAADDQAGQKQIATDIGSILTQLEWTRRLEDELQARGGHPFYLPLSRLLQIIL